MSSWNQPPQPPPPPYGNVPPYGGGEIPPGPGGGGPTFVLATWGKRVLATLVDSAILLGIYAVLGLITVVGFAINDYLGIALLIIDSLVIIAFGIWQIIAQGKTGQTIGKQMIGISVVREADARAIGGWMTFVRSICHYADGACYVGYFWPLWDEKRQTFADKIMHTVAIEGKPPTN